MMKIAAFLLLAAALVAVEAAPPGLPGLPDGGPGGSQCNTGCCNLGQTVFNGACQDFVNAFKSDADTAISESDSAFQARVNRAPRPSSSCCVNARAYTQYGCSCNGDLMNAAASRGYTSNQVRIVGRATRFSICANSDNGGSIGGC
ncbi:g2662 [Coccomyxa viridis]|uniref:G2662 protein n=1 Tax=Coccomyxa viridis TaxID=1274662 RepID=A0ABP1FPX2_9CHLO